MRKILLVILISTSLNVFASERIIKMKFNIRLIFFLLTSLLSFALYAGDYSSLIGYALREQAAAEAAKYKVFKDFLLYGGMFTIIILLILLLLKKDSKTKADSKTLKRNTQSVSAQKDKLFIVDDVKDKSKYSNAKGFIILFYCFMALLLAMAVHFILIAISN